MPAFGCNAITVAFAINIRYRERLVSGDGSEEDPFVYEYIGFKLSDRIVSALDRFIGALSRFRIAGTELLSRWLFIYPFVGGTDWTHAMNLADVAGNFTKFEITWSGAVTHNQNGVTFASGGSGNTNCDFADKITNLDAWNRKTFGLYSRTNSASNTADMNAAFVEPRNGYTYVTRIIPRYGDGIAYSDHVYYSKTGVVTTPNRASVAVADSLGLFTSNQRGSTVQNYHFIYKKGVHIASDNTGEIGMGYGDGIVKAYMILSGTRNIAFVFSTKYKKGIEGRDGPGGTAYPGSNADLNTFVQQLQVALLRQV